MTTTPKPLWCRCTGYTHWHTTDNKQATNICECGHKEDDHLDHRLMCLGDVLQWAADHAHPGQTCEEYEHQPMGQPRYQALLDEVPSEDNRGH